MMIVVGTKVEQTQKFLEDGTRIPVTVVATPGNTVLMHKMQDKEGYWAVQLGLGIKKNANKPQVGHATKAHLDKAPLFVKEARLTEKEAANMPEVGSIVDAATVLEPGAMVDVSGMSKGKGFASGIKRYQFKGGPKTHGQSDRHRAPGSIGSGTTPGRVYKGKRMAGKMGNDITTLKSLEIIKVGADFVWIKGVVPGVLGAMVIIKPTGKKNKKFVEPLKSKEELEEIAKQEQAAKVEAEKQAAEAAKAAEEVARAEQNKEEKAEEVKTEEVKEEVEPEAKEEKVEEPKEEVAEVAKEEAPAENKEDVQPATEEVKEEAKQ
ncbi:MAG TPA: 50S ribosomal protein L3 [Patescibacteria group bacterium]|nr:50S ribosomal protein L3 [Patescibacteria group bacterium]